MKVVWLSKVCGFTVKSISLLEKAKWTRSLHFNNRSFSLNVEVNDRPSHWIINYIFEILVRERLGYRDINFIYTPWNSSSNAINRLNCEKFKDCSRPPPTHVNLELWLRTGEQVSSFAPPHRVRMNGPLGPITRWGLYANEELFNQQEIVCFFCAMAVFEYCFKWRSYLHSYIL